MKKIITLFFFVIALQNLSYSQTTLTPEVALSLSRLPLHCIPVEFPNKTSHLSDGPTDARMLPSELHPVFYGCLDWHSSLHGHWMLIRLLKLFPDLPNRDSIVQILNNSFQIEKMQKEADYFGKYTASTTYERTYGWAWLLKLDEELYTWNDQLGKKWHEALQPLTKKIEKLWKDYLPKQTYPNRTGVHPNTAFGLSFALDWSRTIKDTAFENLIIKKANSFYLNNKNIPGYLEPDGSDFFSPSLEAADLMQRILSKNEFAKWIDVYYSKESIERLCSLPVVSDRNDYQIVHLDGLSFSRAWCMKGIAKKLPDGHPLQKKFREGAAFLLSKTLPNIFSGAYGGEHWLASFAVYAMSIK